MTDRDQQEQNHTNKNETTIHSEGGNVFDGDVSAERDIAGRDIIHNYYTQQNPAEKPADPWHQFAQIPLDHPPAPAPSPPASLIFHRHNKNFTGRQKELRLLAWLLKGGEKGRAEEGETGRTPAVAIAATGLGGIGKTQLAAEFCHRYGRYFAGGVFWLSFENEENGRSSLAQCAPILNEAWVNLDIEQQIQQVQQAWKANIPRLLVFDNIEDHKLLDKYLPTTGGCRVLLTSRKGDWKQSGLPVEPLPLSTLTPDESQHLLQRLAPRLEIDDAQAIAKELGHFPLALHLAGSFLQKYPRETAEAYLKKLKNFDLMGELGKQANRIEHGKINPTAHTWHIARTFEMSYSQIRPAESNSANVDRQLAGGGENHQQADDLQHAKLIKWVARRLLARAAMLAPGEPIPIDLLFATFKTEAEKEKPLVEPDEYQLQDGLNRLIQLGLVEPAEFGTDQQPAVLIHRLTGVFANHSAEIEDDDLTGTQLELFAITSRLNKAGFPRMLLPYQTHLRFVINRPDRQKNNSLASLCNEFAYSLKAEGDYAGAKPYYQQALDIQQEVLGERHPDTTNSLNNLGALLQAEGDYAGAKPYYQQALDIRQEVLGERHPHTARSLNNLGALLDSMGDYAGAKPYYQQALDIRQEVLGERHPDTARSLNNLGFLLQAEGDYAGAKPYYQQALDIRQEVLGERHPHTARSLNNLGALLDSMGDYAGAKPYYQQALDIRQEVLGERHPDTASSLNNLGFLLDSMGDYAGAKPYYQQALDIYKEVLGERHPDTASTLNNLGFLLQAEGDYAGAKPYYQQALDIRQEVLGERHPDTASSLNNLGFLLQAEGDYAGAKPYYQQALDIYKEVLGERHPTTATSLNNLAILAYYQDDFETGVTLMRQALDIRESVLGAEHPNTITARNSLAVIESKLSSG